MASLVVACGLVSIATAGTPPKGAQGGKLQGTWEMQITLTDPRSRDKDLPVTYRIRGGRHGRGVERRDTAGPETPGEGAWRHTTDSTMRFASSSSRLILRTSLRAGRSLRGKQPWIRQEMPIRALQRSKSMTQTATYL